MNRFVDVLLVDDETDFLKSLVEGFAYRADQFNVITADSAHKALDFLRTVKVDVVVVDLNMPGMDGFELLRRLQRLRQSHHGTRVIIMSAYDQATVKHQLKERRYARYVEKPLRLGDLAQAILKTAHGCSGPVQHHAENRIVDVNRGCDAG